MTGSRKTYGFSFWSFWVLPHPLQPGSARQSRTGRSDLTRVAASLDAGPERTDGFSRQPRPPPHRSPDSLQKRRAREDRSLISYFLDDPSRAQGRSARSHVFLLTTDTLRTAAFPDVTNDSVQPLLEGASPLFVSPTTLSGINSIHFDLDHLHDIYRTVFQSVTTRVDRGARLPVCRNARPPGAFRAIGAQSTLSNLWPADDESAVERTRMFYRFLKEGHPKDVALRKAQL